MTQEELELEAEKYAWKKKNPFSKELLANELVFTSKIDFIAGATSKWVEKQKLEFAIEQLNKLDSVLQAKYEILSNMQQENLGKMKEGQLASKKSGLRLAKEKIRRDIKEFEQKLKEYETN